LTDGHRELISQSEVQEPKVYSFIGEVLLTLGLLFSFGSLFLFVGFFLKSLLFPVLPAIQATDEDCHGLIC
jgi:hypothetical protein